MVSKPKALENLKQLQDLLQSSLQGDPRIIEDLKYRRLCSKCTCCTSQCGSFHQDAAGSHPGAGESCNRYTSRQNLGSAADKYDLRAIEPSNYPRCETRDSTRRERPAGKIGTLFNPGQARPSSVQKSDPARSNLKPRPKYLLQKRTKI